MFTRFSTKNGEVLIAPMQVTLIETVGSDQTVSGMDGPRSKIHIVGGASTIVEGDPTAVEKALQEGILNWNMAVAKAAYSLAPGMMADVMKAAEEAMPGEEWKTSTEDDDDDSSPYGG